MDDKQKFWVKAGLSLLPVLTFLALILLYALGRTPTESEALTGLLALLAYVVKDVYGYWIGNSEAQETQAKAIAEQTKTKQ